MSKGSRPRPLSIDQHTFGSNWDKIFKPQSQNSDEQEIIDTIEVLENEEMWSQRIIDEQ